MFDGLGRPFHMDGFCRTGQAARSGYEGAKKDVPTETCIVSVVMNIKRDLNCMISLTDIRFIILLNDCYLLLCRWARKTPQCLILAFLFVVVNLLFKSGFCIFKL